MLNIEAVLAARKAETATVGGIAESVMEADRMAWAALEGVLGTDPVDKWALKEMAHTIAKLESGALATQFKADFVRVPEDES